MVLKITTNTQLSNVVDAPTGMIRLATGTTEQRPVSPTRAMTRYNTQTEYIEYYENSEWRNLDYAVEGTAEFLTPGTFQWIVPENVYSVSVVCIGGGSGGIGSTDLASTGYSGGGGGLGYRNNIAVQPGEKYTVVVGAGGAGGTGPQSYGSAGGDSYFISPNLVKGGGATASYAGDNTGVGGYQGNGGQYVGSGGSNGGQGRSGNTLPSVANLTGGSAGGYPTGVGNAGSMISIKNSSGTVIGGGWGGGGGVSPYGTSIVGAAGGSANSSNGKYYGGSGGLYGGGGGGIYNRYDTCFGGDGAGGCVRIAWGIKRFFPNTNIDKNINLIGEAEFLNPGSATWTAPKDVTRVSIVCIGGGDGFDGNSSQIEYSAGGLAWVNNFEVTPGASYTVVVGDGGNGSTRGGSSYFNSLSTIAGYGGEYNGDYVVTGGTSSGGGKGGKTTNVFNMLNEGGHGAGGYMGDGGAGGSGTSNGSSPMIASGGGAGGGSIEGVAHGGGGGVGIYGQGFDGIPGKTTSSIAYGGGSGSNGSAGGDSSGLYYPPNGGLFGGSAAYSGSNSIKTYGGTGAVRILWGKGRKFPRTNVGRSYINLSPISSGRLAFVGLNDTGVTGDLITTDREYSLTVTGNQPGSTISYYERSGSVDTPISPSITNAIAGVHTYVAKITDLNGNTVETNSISVTVDLSIIPGTLIFDSTTFTDSGSSASDFYTNDNSFGFIVTGAEPSATFQFYEVVSGIRQPISQQISNVSNGVHTYQALTTDGAGNSGYTNTITVTVDISAPSKYNLYFANLDITYGNPPPDSTYNNNYDLTVTGLPPAPNDLTVTYYERTISGDILIPGGNVVSATLGSHTYVAKVTDLAGNTTETTTVSINVLSRPVVAGQSYIVNNAMYGSGWTKLSATTYSWTSPYSTLASIVCVGAGGNGGDGAGGTGGGGGGGCCYVNGFSLTQGATYSITVGNGVDTSFNNIIIAKRGLDGVSAADGAGGAGGSYVINNSPLISGTYGGWSGGNGGDGGNVEPGNGFPGGNGNGAGYIGSAGGGGGGHLGGADEDASSIGALGAINYVSSATNTEHSGMGGGAGTIGQGITSQAGRVGTNDQGGNGGFIGGGGGGSSHSRASPGGKGGPGAIRIIWGSSVVSRSFPAVNTQNV